METIGRKNRGADLLGKARAIDSSETKALYLLAESDRRLFPEKPLLIQDLDPSERHVMEHHYDIGSQGRIINHYYAINRERLRAHEATERDLIGWVLHEVRHRVQLEKKPVLFSRANVDAFPPNIRKRLDALPDALSDKEFDAKATEFILLGLFDRGVSLEEIVDLLLEEYPTLLNRINTP